jgi:hypothetical protein
LSEEAAPARPPRALSSNAVHGFGPDLHGQIVLDNSTGRGRVDSDSFHALLLVPTTAIAPICNPAARGGGWKRGFAREREEAKSLRNRGKIRGNLRSLRNPAILDRTQDVAGSSPASSISRSKSGRFAARTTSSGSRSLGERSRPTATHRRVRPARIEGVARSAVSPQAQTQVEGARQAADDPQDEEHDLESAGLALRVVVDDRERDERNH